MSGMKDAGKQAEALHVEGCATLSLAGPGAGTPIVFHLSPAHG